MIHTIKKTLKKLIVDCRLLIVTQPGFTLVEVLISMIILLTVGSVILSIFMTSLRGTTKVNNLQIVRQNGNHALSQMGKMMQFAQTFDGVSTDGNTFDRDCEAPGGASGSLQQYSHVRFTSFDGGQTTFACENGTIASNSASLIDNVTLTTTECSFTCSQIDVNAPQTIGILFTLEKRNITSVLEDPAPLQFQTSVTLRNIFY